MTRRVVITPEAEMTLGSQIRYLIEQGAVRPALVLQERVETFIRDTLAPFPGTGNRLEGRELWETWNPGTRLVVWYTFTDDELAVITFWHTSQNRPR